MSCGIFLSVVVPTYNRAGVLPRALASLRAQTYADFEVLVADDGSDDDTLEVVKALGDERIRYLYSEHRGVSAARNLGLAAARGEVVTFLDSDDEAAAEWLASIAASFAAPRAGIVSVGMRVVELGSDGKEERIVLPRPFPDLFGPHPLLYAAGTLAAKRDLVRAIGGFDEEIRFAENTEMVLRLVPACLERGLEIRSIDRPLITYYRNPMVRAATPASFARIRSGVERLLEVHGDRLREDFPHGYARFRGVAAVNAGRVGDLTAARRHLRAALRAKPNDVRNMLRLLLTLVPPIARRYWCRYAGMALPPSFA